MTARETEIVKAILDVLHDEDGRQLEEIPLHARVSKNCACTADELGTAVKLANTQGWINGVKGRPSGRFKWNINDAGESARLQL